MKYIIIALCLILTACSPAKRLQRILTKNPDLLQVDSVTVEKLVFVPEYTLDTAFVDSLIYDTTIIENERVRIQVLHDTITKLIRVYATCKPDTVVTECTNYIERYRDHVPSKLPSWLVPVVVVLSLVILILLVKK